ncbi:diacylglycerol kinase family protein [Streptomyces platensis]|uniref:diacylglycerol/lipid kinase family protein n=1 Tax=Streptomyces platensis TaxID=58346 RepID=UPI002E16454F|nr:diacylglycerol kinase family protein [Streptomyces platensis]WSI59636.1 diacylglycerol kinase family protein [Streptomyces platensis]WTI50303.1 diacylglycerol kinase family protein [Streptomyces platensis]WUB84138.1 diacylglycerol kinase family protein [Streptomyces platensis]
MRVDRRWAARLALAAGTAALLVLLVFAGIRSIALVGVGVAGLAATAAGLWWVLAHTGALRVLALMLAIATPVVVLVLYAIAGLLWVVLVSLALWTLAVFTGRTALAPHTEPARTPERPVPPPRRPFLIMNPRSGGGKVGRFHLAEQARALGAEVVELDPAQPQDVAELARRAVDEGADLLGVAGGDGTQALVAGVAAARDVPFVVICAGTRNHFAMDLGLDREDPSACLQALTDGVELRVDLGFIDVGQPTAEGQGRVFVNNASFGAYASVVQSPAYRDDKARTILQMLPDLLTHHSGPGLKVRTDTVSIDGPQAVLVSNNPYRMGDPAGLGRRDRLDSGVLGVLGVTVDNAVQAASMLRGRRGPGLTSIAVPEVVIDADAPAVPAGVDGEALTVPTPVRCWLEPGALRVRLPRHRPGTPRGKPPMDWRRVRRLALTVGRTAAGRDTD